MEKLSLLKELDIGLLRRRLNVYKETHGYNPIILASKETIETMVSFAELTDIFKDLKTHFNDGFGYFDGCKVFMDLTKTYGEVELR